MGATGRGAFDCSGFTMYLFDRAGTDLPRTAADQYRKAQPITKDELRSGDLVFFRNTYRRGISHVGIYIGNGEFCHAAGRGLGVRVDMLSEPYYVHHWAGARRPR
jgi:cell wall-associated NlpC family hydrolase